ncbi:nitrate- and nitrite sensing domain-containing protein [Streptomyces actinomycinicus]|uniref:histidine kinase n=1 Tax=Streptomyces actinomycinicus TaxID=1695166 RepID=A0A937EGW4_9ACTN|nr:sensor histidine kinase [Streptomyces actinomycinicus]MBL1082852.1 nitrate- and nitrite sensing domain-containing protein [Streptomyces actinomycinicus]
MRPPRTPDTTVPPAHPPRGRRAHAGPPADEDTDRPFGTPPKAARARGSRRHLRPRTVRAKVVSLLMVPVVSLLALWAYATVSTAQDVARLRQSQRVEAELRTPVAAAVTALQAERGAAVRYVIGIGNEADLRSLTARSDRAVAKLRLGHDTTVADSQELPAGVSGRLRAFVTGAERLRTLRTAVLDHEAGWAEVYTRYTETIGGAFAVDGALAGVQQADVGSDTRVLLEFSRAAEALAQEDAVLGGARTVGGLQGERRQLFGSAVAARRALTEAAVADLPSAQRAAWHDLASGRAYTGLGAAEDEILAATSSGTALPAAWHADHARVQDGMRTIAAGTGHAVAGRADPVARGLISPAGAAVLLGLAAVAASLVISVRIGRALVVELVSLRNDALEIARRKLPEAMRKLRAGEEIDIRSEAPAGPPADDETGQVAEALTTVHRAALRAAVERAELASGISGVFVNLARRSQVLVHRQLSLLDSMERRSDDPDELSDLFRLDHLTTRMRRHAESLIILSGAAPGRAWRIPVSLTDVVRAAVSEVEDYARVEVRQLPEAHVIGAAVADLTHLLAELVENAAQFSPPHTRVHVTGEPVGNGYALEIEDRGLGMGADTLAEANRRIEQSEALDLFDSDRLGLFVVSRLASRHGIKVHLRTSPYGGTTAVVLVPTALLHSGSAERSARQDEHARPAEERAYARVPAAAPAQEAVTARSDRPALAVTGPGPHATDPGPHPTGSGPHPTGSGPHPTGSGPHPTGSGPLADGPGPHATRPVAQDTADQPPPPGVTTLRLHRPSDGSEPSGDLPRRVRQASLAPQLRARRAEEPAEQPVRHGEDRRTPELVRDRMTAYRDGWARGGGRQPGRGSAPEPETRSDSSEGDPA